MKKRFQLYIMVIILLVFGGIIPISIYEVHASNINYTISYSTTVIGSAQIQREGDLTPERFDRYYGSFKVDITDPTITSEIEKYKQQVLEQINKTTPPAQVSDRTFRDGYVYPIPTESVKDYFRFFELPSNFNGSKVIIKDDIPFTLIGDGKGNLSMTIVSDYIGQIKKTIIIPAEKTHTIKEEMIFSYYHVYIPGQDSYTASTLEEALEYCAQHADSNKEIQIFVQKEYHVNIEAYASRMTYMNITYGNTPKNNSDSLSNNTTQESTTKQEASSVNNTSPSITPNVSIQNNNQTQEDISNNNDILTEKKDNQKSNDANKTNIDTKEKDDINPNEDKGNSSINQLIVICVVFIFVIGIILVLIKTRIKVKKINEDVIKIIN